VDGAGLAGSSSAMQGAGALQKKLVILPECTGIWWMNLS
jgi:hypothetical protein